MYVRQCVRCGSRPRREDSFLCITCSADPQQKKEVAEAMAKVDNDMRFARTYLIKTFRWHGWK